MLNGDNDVSFPPVVGYVYAVVNPAWSGIVKIGSTNSVKSRLNGYQTYDPYRAYRMIGWSDVVLDSFKAERALHAQFRGQLIAGSREWFRITEAQALVALNRLRRVPMASAVLNPFQDEPDGWYDDDGS